MNSLVKVFSNFREFYSEINGATLTGAIDVVVVEQADGSFVCSPFHVRFGKLGVLRSREKIVDIEVNGEPVDIHMKLGESGEAFFVEECPEDFLEELPDNLATSPIPNEFTKYEEQTNEFGDSITEDIPLLKPRRNSIDISKESEEPEKKYENQVSDFKHRRHTDNMVHRRNLSAAKNEFTTQKIRQEWAEHEQEQLMGSSQTSVNWVSASDTVPNDSVQIEVVPTDKVTTDVTPVVELVTPNTVAHSSVSEPKLECDKVCDKKKKDLPKSSSVPTSMGGVEITEIKEESKSKKKRRKKSIMKRKSMAGQTAAQRKGSSSSNSISETAVDNETDQDLSYVSVSNNTNTPNSSNGSSPKVEDVVNSSPLVKETPSFAPTQITDFHFFSDTEVGTALSPRGSRPSTPIKSDSEFEMSHRLNNDADIMNTSASWKWGELPTPAPMEESNDSISDEVKQARRMSMITNMFSFMKQSKKMRKTSQEGIYLSDLEAEGLDPEVEALYFPPISSLNHMDPEDHESGNGTSLPHSPSSIGSPKSVDSDYEEGKFDKTGIALSMCGGLENGNPTDQEFNRHIIQYSEVCQNPTIFSSPSLVVRINGKYYNWAAACPIVMTSLAYRKPLSIDAIEQLVNSNKTTPTEGEPPSSIEIKNENSAVANNARGYSSWFYWRRSVIKRSDDIEAKGLESLPANLSEVSHTDSPNQSQNMTLSSEKSIDEICEKYRKSLRLTSEQIESLNLKEGMNEVVFSVTTAYQGTSRCKCYLFRWKHNDKVVISDIDGTITKSDVLGHILPMVGRDWAQLGVAQLFSKIEENGYKLLYLSARAIGQSRATREYLRSICQGDVKLPDGPLLLNPTSLISAFHREVIERKPEQFKIACLSDIQALFPQNPFYAGYGNRINDVWAYRAVGIPIMRIFTINPKGELKHELTQTFQSTYCSMTYIVDQLFPPVNGTEGSIEFSNVNYWREPLPELDEQLLDNVKIELEQPPVVTTASP